MFDEYLSYYKKYSDLYGPQTAIFLQVGKFYEFYDLLDEHGCGQTTCRKIVDILGIKLSYKKAPQDRDGLWAGVPTQSLHNFASRLTRDNWTCVIIDESKDEKGKISRGVSRILSPGTHLETADSTLSESMFLATVWFEEAAWKLNTAPAFGASVVDLTTGETTSYEGTAVGSADLWTADDLLHFFQVHPPRECVLYWRGDVLSIPSQPLLRARLGLSSTMIHVKTAQPLAQQQREDILMRVFKPRTMLPIRLSLHIEGKATVESSLTALLRFIEEHFPSLTETLTAHKIWLPTERVYLGNNVLDQVNFLNVREENSILGMFMGTHTLMGRRSMRRRLLYPICDIAILKKRLQEIATIRALPKETHKSLEHLMNAIADLSRLHRKIQTYKVSAADVISLEQSYARALRMSAALTGTCLEIPAEMLSSLENYFTDFKKHFDIYKASRVDEDTYFLPEAKAPQTCSLEAELATLKTEVHKTVETIEKWAGLSRDSLKIESRETLLYSVVCSKTIVRQIAQALKSNQEHPFPDMTTTEKKSGANVNIPKLGEIHLAVASKRDQLDSAFQRELPPICQSLSNSYLDLWVYLEEWLGALDVTLTLERVALERGFSAPTYEEGDASTVTAVDMRHPLIEAQQTRTEYIKHTVSLSSSGWLIYGMNASGKSSLMKALGISILLAQCGSYVPASTFTLVPFTSIFTRILNHDNLWAGLSSFAVEMSELREILKHTGKKSLVLGDEVCSGTESTSATSLVAAALVWLTERRSCFLFATHLHGLLDIGAIQNLKGLKVKHLKVRYDPVTGVLLYDRSLHDGAGSSIYGIEVARALQLPHSFIEQAQQFRRELLGTVADEEASVTTWNTELRRRACEVCGEDLVRDIEVHHIRPQKDADETGHFSDGTHKNHIRNLITVCQVCHDKHHADEIEIGPVQQTSEGPVRQVLENTNGKRKIVVHKSKWTSEQQDCILKLLKEKPNATIVRLLYELDEYHGIKISNAILAKVRRSGTF